MCNNHKIVNVYLFTGLSSFKQEVAAAQITFHISLSYRIPLGGLYVKYNNYTAH